MVSFRHASVHMYCACLRVGGWVVRGLRFFCGVLFFDQKRVGGATLHDMFDAMAFHAHYGSLACAFCVGRCSCVMMLARGVDVRVQTLSKQLERMLISSCWRGGRWLSFGLQVMRSFRCKCSTALAHCGAVRYFICSMRDCSRAERFPWDYSKIPPRGSTYP